MGKGKRWGTHMQIPGIRETLFEISKQLNPPKKEQPWRKKKVAKNDGKRS